MSPDVLLDTGAVVGFAGERFVIDQVTTDYHVLARNVGSGEEKKIPISRLEAIADSQAAAEFSLLSIESDDWAEARRRHVFVKQIVNRRVSRDEMREIAEAADVDPATLYRWASKFRASRRLSSLLPFRPSGGRGQSRLDHEVEKLTTEVIQTFFLKPQQPTVKETIEKVTSTVRFAGLQPPSHNAIRSRIAKIAEREKRRRRGHSKASRALDPHPDHYTEALTPLSVVQIDHTKLDIILVDQKTRSNIGRPLITLAIDVFSRMIVGYYISLDPVGNLAAGQCIANMILPKEGLLAELDVPGPWHCWGVPAKLHLDNAKEFRGDMLLVACNEYEINLDYRPLLKPEYGSHIERLMGTLAKEIHKLPGTTFSNPRQRGDYNSEQTAALTLPVLERNLVDWITGVYHQRVHGGIKTAPARKWEEGIFGNSERPGCGLQKRNSNALQVHLDFMPFKVRTVQNYGVQWDGIRYYGDVLRSHIGSSDKFVFKRDPRNIREIYFLDPQTRRYVAIPYRDSRLPDLSIWELRTIQAQLHDEGRASVDESAIIETYERIRLRVQREVVETKNVRRSRARQEHRKQLPSPVPVESDGAATLSRTPKSTRLEPFEIEDL